MSDLKPCPLCKRQPRRNGRRGAGGVLCTGDNRTIGEIHRFQTYGADQAEADAAWNAAATPTTDPADIAEKVREMCLGAVSSVRTQFRDMLANASPTSMITIVECMKACSLSLAAIRALDLTDNGAPGPSEVLSAIVGAPMPDPAAFKIERNEG